MAAVDILLPTYNRGDFLPECLRSLLQQTFKDFRILLWDDGSTDRSTTPAALPADPRIVVLNRGGRNKGIPAARNELLKRVEAPYFCWQDSDDVAHLQRLEKLHAFMETERQYAGVFSPLYFFNGSWSRRHWHLYKVDPSRWAIPAKGGNFGMANNFTFASSFYRREVAETLFDLSKPVAEDHAWVRELLRRGFRFGAVTEPLYYARRHPNRTTTLFGQKK